MRISAGVQTCALPISKTRHQFYLPDDLSEKLEQLTSSPGASKTAVLTEALKAWIDRRATHELDDRFGHRLDRFSREHERIHRRPDRIPEALGVFVHHQLTHVAHPPPFHSEDQQHVVQGKRGVSRLNYGG